MARNVLLCVHHGGFRCGNDRILLKRKFIHFRRCILYHCGICGYSSPNLHDTVAYSVGATALYALLPADVHSPGFCNP